VRPRLYIAAATIAAIIALTGWSPRAQTSSSAQASGDRSDLEAFMKQVLSRRDDNWKKLQQYTLEEDETFLLTALNGRKLYGFKREYSWYPQDPATALASGDAIFVRSPISADGVKISEDERRKAEADWLKREQNREKTRQEREEKRAKENPNSQPANSQRDDDVQVHVDSDAGTVEAPGLNDLVEPGNEPRFVSSAYFMKFKFDAGSYALAGRERLLGRDVLKIEYYPQQYFKDPPKKTDDPKKQKANEREERFEAKMDKVSMITMWIEPKDHQILQYEFSNIDFDFMPGRSLMRLDELRASMRMREAFPQVWLPDQIAMSFGMTLALGEVSARYDVKYHDYKLAEVKARVR
jgi:hypothetical protein